MSRTHDALTTASAPRSPDWYEKLTAEKEAREREEWLAQRRQGIGSSDAAAVCGLDTWRTPLEVYLDKVEPREGDDSIARELGRIAEDAVARIYGRITGLLVTPPNEKIATHPIHQWMLASLDRMARTGLALDYRIVEVKTVWGDTSQWGEPGTDEIPDTYLIQVQHQMGVTGLEVADVAALMRGQSLNIYTVKRDQKFINRLIAIEEDFWDRVQRREPPTLDYQHPKALELVQRLHPRVQARSEITLPTPDSLALAREILRLRGVMGEYKKMERSLRALLLGQMGSAEVAHLADGGGGMKLTRVARSRKGFSVEPSEWVELKISSSNEVEVREDEE